MQYQAISNIDTKQDSTDVIMQDSIDQQQESIYNIEQGDQRRQPVVIIRSPATYKHKSNNNSSTLNGANATATSSGSSIKGVASNPINNFQFTSSNFFNRNLTPNKDLINLTQTSYPKDHEPSPTKRGKKASAANNRWLYSMNELQKTMPIALKQTTTVFPGPPASSQLQIKAGGLKAQPVNPRLLLTSKYMNSSQRCKTQLQQQQNQF